MLAFAGAAAGDHWDADGFADTPRNHKIKAGLGAVGVDAVEHDLTRAQSHSPVRPLDSFQAGRFASAVRKHLPSVRRDAFGVNGYNDALAAEFLGAGVDEIRVGKSGGV